MLSNALASIDPATIVVPAVTHRTCRHHYSSCPCNAEAKSPVVSPHTEVGILHLRQGKGIPEKE